MIIAMDGTKTFILRLEYPQLFDSGAGPDRILHVFWIKTFIRPTFVFEQKYLNKTLL